MKLDFDISGDALWAIFWLTLGACIITLIIALAVSSFDKRDHIKALVDAGADPMEAYCAFSGSADVCELRQINTVEAALRHIQNNVTTE